MSLYTHAPLLGGFAVYTHAPLGECVCLLPCPGRMWLHAAALAVAPGQYIWPALIVLLLRLDFHWQQGGCC
eukprot:13993994-Heterocapsa_arctica.AAC.1